MRITFPAFCIAVNPAFYRAPHIQHLSMVYHKFAWGDPDYLRIMVEAPVRHGKSYLGSIMLQAYMLGEFPGEELMLLTYGQDLSGKFSLGIREIVESPGYQRIYEGVKVIIANSKMVRLDNGAMLHTLYRGGAASGMGAFRLTADDLIKNYEEARSDTERQKVWEWWQSVAELRLQGVDCPACIINTRWHYDDICGRLLESEKKLGDDAYFKWKRITMRAEAEEDEQWPIWQDKIWERKEGEALWATQKRLNKVTGKVEEMPMFPKAYLKHRRLIEPTVYYALFQQRPSAKEGNIFKRSHWKYYEPGENKYVTVLLSVDSANKPKPTSDYTCLGAFGLTADGHVDIIDVLRGKWSQSQIYEMIAGYDDDEDDMHVPGAIQQYNVQILLIEDHGSGEWLIHQVMASDTLMVETVGLRKTLSKESYAHGVSHYVRMGRIRLPIGGEFVPVFLDEVCGFPEVKNDDMVDMLTQCLNFMKDVGMLAPIVADMGLAEG